MTAPITAPNPNGPPPPRKAEQKAKGSTPKAGGEDKKPQPLRPSKRLFTDLRDRLSAESPYHALFGWILGEEVVLPEDIAVPLRAIEAARSAKKGTRSLVETLAGTTGGIALSRLLRPLEKAKAELVAESSLMLSSGRMFCPLAPDSDDFTWEDVAWGLATQNRFGGHLQAARRQVYTVAQHVVLAARQASPTFRAAVFHHDDVEALWGFGDVCGPVKRIPAVKAVLGPIERACEKAVAEKAGLEPDFASLPAVKAIDAFMLRWENRDLREIQPPPGVLLPRERIEPWSPERAFEEWMSMHKALGGAKS